MSFLKFTPIWLSSRPGMSGEELSWFDPRRSPGAGRLYWIAFGVGALLLIPLVLALHRAQSPPPVWFPSMRGDVPERFIEFGPDQIASVAFNSVSGRERAVYFRVWFRDGRHQIRLTARNESQDGRVIGQSDLGYGLDAAVHFNPGDIRPGDRLQFDFQVVRYSKKVDVPALIKRQKEGDRSSFAIDVTIDGKPVAEKPQMVIQYRSGLEWLQWLWIPAFLGTLAVIRWPFLLWPWFMLVVACMVLTSWHGWQQRYACHAGHLDPDRYGEAGYYMHQWLTNPVKRASAQSYLHDTQHTFAGLVSAAVCVAMLAGFSMGDGYLYVSMLASLGSVLIFHHLLQRKFALSRALALVGTLAFASHFVVLRFSGRPCTDTAGLFLVVAMLWMLADRLQRRNAAQTAWIIVLACLLSFVRPPGLAFAAFLIGMTPVCDWLRTRKLDWKEFFKTGFQVGWPVLGFVALMYLSFDFNHNFQAFLLKNKAGAGQHTFHWLVTGLLVNFQLFVLGWIFVSFKNNRWIPALIPAAWIVWYYLILFLSKAAMPVRVIEPAVPAVIALCCLGLQRFRDRPLWNGIAMGGMGALAAVNLIALVSVQQLAYMPEAPWDRYLYDM